MPAEQPLSRKVALVTGAGGGTSGLSMLNLWITHNLRLDRPLGKAIADKLVAERAVVVLSEIKEEALKEANGTYKCDQSTFAVCDVTDADAIGQAFGWGAMFVEE